MTFRKFRRAFLSGVTFITACGMVPESSQPDASTDQAISPVINESDAKNVRYHNGNFYLNDGEPVQTALPLTVTANGDIYFRDGETIVGNVDLNDPAEKVAWCQNGQCTATILTSSETATRVLLVSPVAPDVLDGQVTDGQSDAEASPIKRKRPRRVLRTSTLPPVNLSGECCDIGIRQYGTATCWYNSTASLIEWYLRKSGFKTARVSRPYVLARLPFQSADTDALLGASGANLWIEDSKFPSQAHYNRYTSFRSAMDNARTISSQLDAEAKAVPKIAITKIFHYGRTAGKSSRADVGKICAWMRTNQSPLHLFAMYGSIWHAIVGLGCTQDDTNVLIADTVGCSKNTNHCNKWYTSGNLASILYGAVGTHFDNGIDVPVPAGIENFQTQVVYGNVVDNGQKEFALRITGTASDMNQVQSVTWQIDGTFGKWATFKTNDSNNNFATSGYTTSIRTWSTKGAILHLKDGRDLILPGAKINWE
ncbi:hypothetical protein EBZ80_14940 [bacterium]|nr:hypothetical protein [bacterium]